MLNLNQQKLNLNQYLTFKKLLMCARTTVYNCHVQQHRTILIIFPLILQTIIARMMSNGGEGAQHE